MCAAYNGHAHVMEALLHRGAKVDMTTEVSALLQEQWKSYECFLLSVAMLALYMDH